MWLRYFGRPSLIVATMCTVAVVCTNSAVATKAEFQLPDDRMWELVSPPNKHGAGLEPMATEGSVIQAAANGSALTYIANSPISSSPAGNRALEYAQVISRRTGGGWVSEDIATPHEEVAQMDVGSQVEYKFFSEDLSFGLVEPKGATPLPPLEAGAEKTPYRRDDENGGFLPLVTEANVREGAVFGDEAAENTVAFAGASPDLGHVVLTSEEALSSKYPASSKGINLYEWSGGRLAQVNIFPNGKTSVEEGVTDTSLGFNNEKIVRNAISNDGSRVVWTAERHLYIRDVASEETVQLDVPEVGVSGGSGEPEFQDASADGSRVFFTDGTRLTTNATASGADLYVFEVTSGNPLQGRLVDLTHVLIEGEGAEVLGVVPGASEDGSYVYFVANGMLAPGASEGNCRAFPKLEHTCSLYIVHNNGSEWEDPTFIAKLSNGDQPDWGGAAGVDNLADLTARVSPDGQYFAFMSEMSLTGYDNQDASSGVPDEEVYLYDARTGTLTCASCNPTGSSPQGVFDPNFTEEPQGPPPMLIDQPGVWSGHWLAASVVGLTPIDSTHAVRQSRYLSDSGRLFFNSSDALVPSDVNGTEDVYEYEPEGPTCDSENHSASEVFRPANAPEAAGCVALISSGTSGRESAFLDASGIGPGGEEGEDVFFLTAAQLLPSQDIDSAYDIYDAHICSATSPCPSPSAGASAPCGEVDLCRGSSPLTPESFGPPASATLSGAGNLAPTVASRPGKSTTMSGNQKLKKAFAACKHLRKRPRAVCKRRARKRYGIKSSVTAKSGRRGR